MAKPVLLDVVQDLLSDIDGDEVNSISDTVESMQIATVVRDVFRNLVDTYNIETIKTTFQLTASGTTAKPTHMTVPVGTHSVELVRYDKATTAGGDQDYQFVHWLEPAEFLRMTGTRTESSTEVTEVTDDSGVLILVRNDVAPTYFTSLDGGDTFVFDSYNSAIESTLQTSKTMCYGVTKPDVILSDTAAIDLPHSLFTLLRNEARAMVFELYKGGVTAKVEQMARRSRNTALRLRHVTKINRERDSINNYGRPRRK